VVADRRMLALTLLAASGTLVAMGAVLAGPTLRDCADDPAGLFGCLRIATLERLQLLPASEPVTLASVAEAGFAEAVQAVAEIALATAARVDLSADGVAGPAPVAALGARVDLDVPVRIAVAASADALTAPALDGAAQVALVPAGEIAPGSLLADVAAPPPLAADAALPLRPVPRLDIEARGELHAAAAARLDWPLVLRWAHMELAAEPAIAPAADATTDLALAAIPSLGVAQFTADPATGAALTADGGPMRFAPRFGSAKLAALAVSGPRLDTPALDGVALTPPLRLAIAAEGEAAVGLVAAVPDAAVRVPIVAVPRLALEVSAETGDGVGLDAASEIALRPPLLERPVRVVEAIAPRPLPPAATAETRRSFPSVTVLASPAAPSVTELPARRGTPDSSVVYLGKPGR
jgi:hypothetical protein